MKKIILNLLEFIRGSAQFMPISEMDDDWIYPIDQDFTLQDEARFYSPKDKNGLPIKRYRSVGDQYNPTRISAFALSHWNRFRQYGEEINRTAFLQAARWFQESAQDGKWFYQFDWESLKAPWISCMAQGEAMSVLTRAAVLTGDQGYVETARKALEPFKHDIQDGGVRSRLPNGSIFFEEYPEEKSVHVLNGYLAAIIGLIDINKIDPRSDIQEILEESKGILEKNLHLWDIHGWSAYDLHNQGVGPRNPCTASYHRLQATQLRYLGAMLQSHPIMHQANIWERSSRSLPKRLVAAAGKISYRLRHRAQR